MPGVTTYMHFAYIDMCFEKIIIKILFPLLLVKTKLIADKAYVIFTIIFLNHML